ncbi:MAG: hypothetical protein ACLPQL_11170, partial [Desulfobaccales bacterium]
ADIEVDMAWTMPHYSSTYNTPSISNCYIIATRDLMTRYTGTATLTNGGTTVTFSTSQTGLSGLNLVVENDTSVGLYTLSGVDGRNNQHMEILTQLKHDLQALRRTKPGAAGTIGGCPMERDWHSP